MTSVPAGDGGIEEDLLTNQRLIKTGEGVNQALAVDVRPKTAYGPDPSPTFRTPAQ